MTRPRIIRRTVTVEELRNDLDRILAEEGMTYEEFVRRGQSDELGVRLESDRLRDAWLIVGAIQLVDTE